MACGPSVDGGTGGDGASASPAASGGAATAFAAEASAIAALNAAVAATAAWTGGGATAGFSLAVSPGGGVLCGVVGAFTAGGATTVFLDAAGGVSDGFGDASPSTHPSGGEIITMLPHLGHSWICPMAMRFRTAMRARQVVQDVENSGFSTLVRLYRPCGKSKGA
jgi:hypothetical protein